MVIRTMMPAGSTGKTVMLTMAADTVAAREHENKTDCRPILQRKDEHMAVKSGLRKIFVCSPFRGLGDSEEEARKDYRRNVSLAKGVCRYITEKGSIPYCPHLYFPRFLMDSDPDERELGMLMGQTWLAQCSELWIIGHRISKGMEKEIAQAKEWGIPIKHYVLKRTPEERLLDAILHPEIKFYELV